MWYEELKTIYGLLSLLLWVTERQNNPVWTVYFTLSTARCLYQVQCIPSTLYDSLYVLTLSSLLYRPWVATFVTVVISPKSIRSHWFVLLRFGHQAPTCLPSLKRLSLASEGLWLLSKLPEAVNELSGIRLSSKPSETEHLWTAKQQEILGNCMSPTV